MLQFFEADRTAKRDPMSLALDVLFAFGFGVLIVTQMTRPDTVEVFGSPDPIGWVLVLGPTMLIAVRRFAPTTVLAIAVVLYLLAGIDHGEGNSMLAIPALAYMVAATRPPKLSLALSAVGVVLVSLTAFYGPGDIDEIDGGAPIVVLVFFGIGWAIGAQVRRSQLRQTELTEQAEATQAEIDALTRQAVADERSRIARELHDAVGHAVNLMVVQAGAERLVTPDGQSAETFQQIEQVGRSALADLDRMLGLLDAEHDDAAPTEPTQGFADIARLIDGVRSAGADVHYENQCDGELTGRFDHPIGTAAYRIVQEALTNALKHAGPARIDVSLACVDDHLVVEVVDDGRGSAAPRPAGGGRGIVGMRERASVHAGTLEAGPRVGGGFRVEARLPRSAGES